MLLVDLGVNLGVFVELLASSRFLESRLLASHKEKGVTSYVSIVED